MRKKLLYSIIIPVVALICCALAVVAQRRGIDENSMNKEKENPIIDNGDDLTAPVETPVECLILTASEDENALRFCQAMEEVLDEMRVGYDVVDLSQYKEKPYDYSNLYQYRNLVLTMEEWDVIGENLFDITKWVSKGGHMMNMATPRPDLYFNAVKGKLGVLESNNDYAEISGVCIQDNYMVGTEKQKLFQFTDEHSTVDISLNLLLEPEAQVFITADDGELPILWSYESGKGRYVILNESIIEKYQRGFWAFQYSLLEDAYIYPVINASAYYLDDFPSPVPEGNGEYVRADYGVSIASFYSTIWWPEVLNWEKNYGIKHTGLIIEQYSDDVEAPFHKNDATSQFLTFGNMLLNNGGELGFHGYNHQPLCLKGVDESQQYGDYKLWKSGEDVEASIKELGRFSTNLFPKQKFQVYVPPSNIISQEGIKHLKKAWPDIQCIASTYLDDKEAKAFTQEFCVEDNGIISTPRITSGCEIGSYQMITALSELNFHFVQSHFLHPDDVLDEDRGAKLGWSVLSANFRDYLGWIQSEAPQLREATGTQMGMAVKTYDQLTVNRKYTGKGMKIELGGFGKEACFFLRLNGVTVEDTKGCTLKKVANGLYLVYATESELEINY